MSFAVVTLAKTTAYVKTAARELEVFQGNWFWEPNTKDKRYSTTKNIFIRVYWNDICVS